MAKEKIERVGIVGMGKMGLPIVRHLIAGGFAVTGCDVSDGARISLPLCGGVKEIMKGIKIELGDPMPQEVEG